MIVIIYAQWRNIIDNIEIVNIENDDVVNMELILNEYINTNYIII